MALLLNTEDAIDHGASTMTRELSDEDSGVEISSSASSESSLSLSSVQDLGHQPRRKTAHPKKRPCHAEVLTTRRSSCVASSDSSISSDHERPGSRSSDFRLATSHRRDEDRCLDLTVKNVKVTTTTTDAAAAAAATVAAAAEVAATAVADLTRDETTTTTAMTTMTPLKKRLRSDSPKKIRLSSSPAAANGNESSSSSSSCSSSSSSSSSNVVVRQRRVEANARERCRVHTIGAAFESLRTAIPAYSNGQKLSKLTILRLASSYIRALSSLLDDQTERFEESVQACSAAIHLDGKVRRR